MEPFVKVMSSEFEITLQRRVAKAGVAPNILSVERQDDVFRVSMENLGQNTIYDLYGEEPDDVPDHVWKKIVEMLKMMYYTLDIEYVDITPFNFMYVNGKVYVIDFGDANYRVGDMNWFLQEVFAYPRLKQWNPDFA